MQITPRAQERMTSLLAESDDPRKTFRIFMKGFG